jgi:hypothetical protein
MLVLVGACGESARQVIERHRQAAEPVLAQIRELGPIVKSQPPVTTTEWKLPAGVKLDFVPSSYEGQKVVPRPEYNTAIAYEEHVLGLCDSKWKQWSEKPGDDHFPLQIHEQAWLLDPACLLTKGTPWWMDEMPSNAIIDERLSQLERTRYVLVLRLRDLGRPGLISDELAQGEMKHFRPGHVKGDGVLFEVATGAYLGGFPIAVTLPDTVEVRDRDVHGQLALKLAGETKQAIRAELAAVGTPPPG